MEKRLHLLKENQLLYQKIYLQSQQLSGYLRSERLIETLIGRFSLYVNVVNREGNIIYSNGMGLSEIGLSGFQLQGANVFEKYPYLRKFFKRAIKGKVVQFSNVGDYEGIKWKFRNWLIPVYSPDLYIVNIGLNSRYFQEALQFPQGKKGHMFPDKGYNEIENEWKDKIKKVAHDLRSPLNSIGSLVEIMEHKIGDTDLEEELGKTKGIIQRMKSLIIAHLDAKQENDPLDIKGHVDCQALLRDVKTDLSAITGNATVTIKNKSLPVIYGNSIQLHQLFLNLIDNAIKFNDHKKPRVVIKLKGLKKAWRFAIKDNGIGIKKKHRNRIFEYKKRSGKTGHFEGMGIGLSTCKTIVESHGGKIWVKSAPGQGSTFYFTLPK